MTDARITPANGRVALIGLKGAVEAEEYVSATARQLAVPVADLLRAPHGPRDRQLLFGDMFDVLEDRDGWSFGQARKDGYVGYIASDQLRDIAPATHFVAVRSTHSYPAEDFKQREIAAYSFGCRVTVVAESRKYFETDTGQFVPKSHLRPLSQPFRDPVTVAQIFFGTPYLWGGNSSVGIDCSGLVQAACLACDIPCPGDSDMQENCLGHLLPDDADLMRGDILFWRGHVGMMVDSDTLIHANAHHMAVAYEPVKQACLRIEAQNGGRVTARRRLD